MNLILKKRASSVRNEERPSVNKLSMDSSVRMMSLEILFVLISRLWLQRFVDSEVGIESLGRAVMRRTLSHQTVIFDILVKTLQDFFLSCIDIRFYEIHHLC